MISQDKFKWQEELKCYYQEDPSITLQKNSLQDVSDVTSVGAHGLAIGRNIWQHEKPIELSKAVRDVQIRGKDIYTALKRLEN